MVTMINTMNCGRLAKCFRSARSLLWPHKRGGQEAQLVRRARKVAPNDASWARRELADRSLGGIFCVN